MIQSEEPKGLGKYEWLVTTPLGLLITFSVLTVFFGILANWIDQSKYLMFGCLVYPVTYCLTLIFWAWIVNPIKWLIAKIKGGSTK